MSVALKASVYRKTLEEFPMQNLWVPAGRQVTQGICEPRKRRSVKAEQASEGLLYQKCFTTSPESTISVNRLLAKRLAPILKN